MASPSRRPRSSSGPTTRFLQKKFVRYIYWIDIVFILTFSHSCLRVARAPRSETSRTSPTAQLWRSSTSSTSWSLGPSIMNLSRLGQVYLMRWIKLLMTINKLNSSLKRRKIFGEVWSMEEKKKQKRKGRKVFREGKYSVGRGEAEPNPTFLANTSVTDHPAVFLGFVYLH